MPTIKIPATDRLRGRATVLRWLRRSGSAVVQGEPLVLLETDDGVFQVEAPQAGRLGRLHLTDGQSAEPLAALADLDVESTPSPAPAAASQVQASQAPLPQAAQPMTSSQASGGPVIPILMPKAGQSMEEGTILKWRVQPGQTIRKGDVLFELETDKSSMDIEATDEGRLARIVLPEGGTLGVLLPVAFLADSDADVDAYLASQGGGSAAPTPVATSVQTAAQTAAPSPQRSSGVASPSVRSGERVKASPAARKIARERGIDLGQLTQGTGPGGRILSTDVPLTGKAAAPGRRPMSRMRKAIARNLALSKQTIPHFYIRLTIDAEPILRFYQGEKAKYPCSINDVIVRACARGIQEFPAFRSRLEGDEIVEIAESNVGIAVGLDDGLVVPVLARAETLNLQQTGAETRRLALAARAGKVEGMGLGTFTISNMGMYGTEEFAAIINPPETAILAVGSARETVIVRDGALRPGKVITLTMSVDHRVIDGALAAKFCGRLKELLENPAQLA